MTQKTTSYFCPKCQSPLINVSSLAGGEASCSACAWSGKKEELIGYQYETGFDNAEGVIAAFSRDIKMLLARDGTGVKLGELILKWGFVETVDVPTLSRFLGAAARGIATAILEERRTIEKEKQSVS